jgi:hypothetical protein
MARAQFGQDHSHSWSCAARKEQLPWTVTSSTHRLRPPGLEDQNEDASSYLVTVVNPSAASSVYGKFDELDLLLGAPDRRHGM